MFNKRDQAENETSQTAEHPKPAASPAAAPARTSGNTATIGASIQINGEVHGEENLIIEGQINGTVNLKSHTLTIGNNGKVEAEVFAHSVIIDGVVLGDVLAAEQISIRQSARVQGNLIAPRISLEDGAKFRGSIDMDTESERFRKTFAQPTKINPVSKPAKTEAVPDKPKDDKSAADKVSGVA